MILGTYASSMLGVSPLRYGTLEINRDHSAGGNTLADAHCHDCNEVRVNSATALIQA